MPHLYARILSPRIFHSIKGFFDCAALTRSSAQNDIPTPWR
jgi:hypothetical protein